MSEHPRSEVLVSVGIGVVEGVGVGVGVVLGSEDPGVELSELGTLEGAGVLDDKEPLDVVGNGFVGEGPVPPPNTISEALAQKATKRLTYKGDGFMSIIRSRATWGWTVRFRRTLLSSQATCAT